MKKNRKVIGWKVYSGFILFFSVLLYTLFMSGKNTRQLVIDIQSVEKTYAFMHKLHDLTSTLSEAETANNSFILIGKERHLKIYQKKTAELLQKLIELSEPNQVFQGKMITPRLKTLVQEKISSMNLAIAQRQSSDLNHALQIFLTVRWQKLAEEIPEEMRLNFEKQQATLSEELSNKSHSADETIRSMTVVSVLGLLLFLCAAFLIISEIKLRLDYEQQLEQSFECKSMFLASMSHEIRTPMNGVLGMASLLLQTPLNEKQTQYASIIESSSTALLRIVNDILDISKVEAGKLDIIYENFDLKKILSEMEYLFRNLVKEKKKNIEIVFVVDPDIPDLLKGDSGRIRQMLNNLIGNAIKFTDQGFVRVSCRRASKDSSVVRFEITDTGIGMSEKDQKKIFGAFEQASEKTALLYGGTGLGLNISKKMIEAMSGKIGFASQLGQGSEFWFEIDLPHAPPVQEGPLNTMTSQSLSQAPRVRKSRILAADDNETNLILLQAYLGEDHYDLDCATDGKNAYEMFQQKDYDLVLMDVQMPIMDGLESTTRIRQFENKYAKAQTPIIALTGGVTEPEILRCRQSGCNDHLAKPLLRDVFLSTVEKYLDSYPEQIKKRAS